MTEATTCPDFCRHLGEGRLCEVACGHTKAACPNDDPVLMQALNRLGPTPGEIWKGKYKRCENEQR